MGISIEKDIEEILKKTKAYWAGETRNVEFIARTQSTLEETKQITKNYISSLTETATSLNKLHKEIVSVEKAKIKIKNTLEFIRSEKKKCRDLLKEESVDAKMYSNREFRTLLIGQDLDLETISRGKASRYYSLFKNKKEAEKKLEMEQQQLKHAFRLEKRRREGK